MNKHEIANCGEDFLSCGNCYCRDKDPDYLEDKLTVHRWKCRKAGFWTKFFYEDFCRKAIDADADRVVKEFRERQQKELAEKREVPELLKEIRDLCYVIVGKMKAAEERELEKESVKGETAE